MAIENLREPRRLDAADRATRHISGDKKSETGRLQEIQTHHEAQSAHKN